MWTNSVLSELLKINYPLIQAPMAGNATTPAFIAAAANAGVLGSIGAGYLSASDLRKIIVETRDLTDKPFAVNLFVPQSASASSNQIAKAKQCIETACEELHLKLKEVGPPYVPNFEDQMEVVLEEEIPIFSFTFGIPDESWIDQLKANGVILIGTATTLPEGQMLMEQGIDIIVAQGKEAGGHRGSFLGAVKDSLVSLSDLVRQLVDEVEVPVVAAGGIMDARDIFSALSLGALGVQMGTAFLSCPESGIHPDYKKALLTMKSDETVLTRAFSGKFARGIKNKFIERMSKHENEILPYPIQHALTLEMRKVAQQQNNIEFMSMWAGQAAFKSQGLPIAELIERLNSDMLQLSGNVSVSQE